MAFRPNRNDSFKMENAIRCVRMKEFPSFPFNTSNQFFFFFVFVLADDLITTSSSYSIRFDDAFWSAVEGNEESMTFSLKSNARLAASRETFVKTATVVATVYVDGNLVILIFFAIEIDSVLS